MELKPKLSASRTVQVGEPQSNSVTGTEVSRTMQVRVAAGSCGKMLRRWDDGGNAPIPVCTVTIAPCSTVGLPQVLNNLKSQLSDMVAAGHQLRKQIAERKQVGPGSRICLPHAVQCLRHCRVHTLSAHLVTAQMHGRELLEWVGRLYVWLYNRQACVRARRAANAALRDLARPHYAMHTLCFLRNAFKSLRRTWPASTPSTATCWTTRHAGSAPYGASSWSRRTCEYGSCCGVVVHDRDVVAYR